MRTPTAKKTLIALALSLASLQAAAAETIGTLTAEHATISRSGARLSQGTAISLGDQLASNATGEGVVVFDDESSARMGPNAVLTIDEFVYDPARRSGTVKLSQTSGLARIYGGQISKRGTSEVRTPHIVLGVRGGIVDLAVINGQTIATLRGGLMVCRAAGKKKTVTHPGMSCISDGQSLEIRRILTGGTQLIVPAFAGGGGSTGGDGYDGAHCASKMASSLCNSRDGGLPGPGLPSPDDSQTGGPGGGTYNYNW